MLQRLKIVMPNEDSKLAARLEQRLARLILPDKKKIQRVDAEIEEWDTSIQAPIRPSRLFIQRQQYYTGDA
jgi:hypothetical protein